MSDYGDMCRDIREDEKVKKRMRSSRFNQTINDLIILFDIEVQVIQEWHLRFTFPKGRWDFYTTRGRATWVGSNRWSTLNFIQLEEFIRQQYPDHPENKK